MLQYKDDEEVGAKEEDDDVLLKEILQNIKAGRDHASKWRSQAETCYDYFAGHHWSEDDIARLEEQKRPAVTFNRIPRTINAVSGLEIQNRQEVRYLPREMGDVKTSEIMTGSAKWVRDNCDAEDEESEAFQDMLIGGMGWTETFLDYETNPDGSILISKRDPLEFGWDPGSQKRNLDDARFIFRDKPMLKKEVKAMWDIELESDVALPSNSDDPHNAEEAQFYRNDQSDKLSKKNHVIVTQYQWWEREVFYRVVSETGNLKELSTSKFNKVKEYINAKGLRYVKQTRRVYKQAFIYGRQILEMGPAPCNGFTFRCMTGLRDRNHGHWFGLVFLMIDPQMWANKFFSQMMHIVNSNAKGGLLFETGAIKNIRKAEEDWAKPDAMVELNVGGMAKIQQREAPRYPEGVDRLLQYAMQSINDIPGINLEMLGMANKDQAVYLEQSRKDAGVTILATFFDSLRRYRKEQGRVLGNFIKDYIADGRLVKVVGPEMAQYVPLIKQQLDFEYDIIVDDAPTSPNMKEKTFAILSQLLPMVFQAGIPVPSALLDYAPLPEALIQKWKKEIEDRTNSPAIQKEQQAKDAMTQLSVQEQAIINEELKSQIQLNQAKALKEQALASDEGAQAMTKLGLDKAHNDMKIQTMQQEQHRKDVEMQMNQRRKDVELEADLARDLLIKGSREKRPNF